MLPNVGLCQSSDKGLNKRSIPFDPALWFSLAKSAVCTQKAAKWLRQLQFIFRESVYFLTMLVVKGTTSLHGEEPHAVCVLIKQPDIMGAQILRE